MAYPEVRPSLAQRALGPYLGGNEASRLAFGALGHVRDDEDIIPAILSRCTDDVLATLLAEAAFPAPPEHVPNPGPVIPAGGLELYGDDLAQILRDGARCALQEAAESPETGDRWPEDTRALPLSRAAVAALEGVKAWVDREDTDEGCKAAFVEAFARRLPSIPAFRAALVAAAGHVIVARLRAARAEAGAAAHRYHGRDGNPCTNPTPETCGVCNGDLVDCLTCGGAEAALPTECPGRRMTVEEMDEVRRGTLDFIGGRWLDPTTGQTR